MIRFILVISSLPILLFAKGKSVEKDQTKTLRTYMPFTSPIDPMSVKTLVDLELSYALGTTLVGWTSSRELTSQLASSWEFIGENEVHFKISKKAKWSDGSVITAQNYVDSLEVAKKNHPEELSSLFNTLTSIVAKDTSTVVFKLNSSAAKSSLLRKLTEPMYGLFSVRSGKINFEKSAGAYSLQFAKDSEIQLSANKHSLVYDSAMPQVVVIRKPVKGAELQASFLNDTWANLFSTTSLMPEGLSKKFEGAGYKKWNRSLDRSFFFGMGKRLSTEDGRNLFKYLYAKMNRQDLFKNLSGYSLTEQFFPKGYSLFDSEFSFDKSNVLLPEKYKKDALTIMAIESKMDENLKSNISTEIKRLTGVEPRFKLIPLSDLEKNRTSNDYDIFAAALPVNDPNVEGAIGFYFGLTPPVIPNGAGESEDFKKQIEAAKKLLEENQRIAQFRKIFTKATQAGCVLPLFHYSTVVLAKDGLDLSAIPTTDETISFSKVRFK